LKKLLFLLVFLLSLSGFSQPYSLSEDAEISILTIGPGKNLYDKFGHSAFRVKDVAQGIDWAYNYGTYDFNQPNFYTKFAQGKLLYSLSISYYEPFFENYVEENRWVTEQVLNLTQSEKNELFRYLQNNAKPENKDYRYDFFFDNCATRIRDVLVAVLGNSLHYDDAFVTEEKTFRELIQQNVHWNTWGSLGMDVAIGAVVDKTASPWDYQFLPQYVHDAAAVATVQNGSAKEPLIKSQNQLFANNPTTENDNFFITPLFWFSLIALFTLWLTYKDWKHNSRNRTLDTILFTVNGIIGVLLCLLWFATDHSATAMNYNLLWAFPVSLLAGPLLARTKPPHWIRKYVFLLLVMMALMVLHTFTGVQKFAPAFLPYFIALALRYAYLRKVLSAKREE